MIRYLLFSLFFLGLIFNSCQNPSPTNGSDYRDTTLSIESRVQDLIVRMTLDEKLAQFDLVPGTIDDSPGGGSFGFMTNHLAPDKAAEEYNNRQRQQIENTRLGIPATRSGEGLYAYMGNGSTSFPQPIAVAASFNEENVTKMAEILALELQSRGIRRVLAPVVNLTRDPRWGRANETYGEDPYLSGIMGAAYIRPMEAAGMITMTKHFVANMGLDGQFTGPVYFSERLLREMYFPAFKACVDAGTSSFMMAYNTLNGIPCATHKWLITDILKNEWGFNGYVSTDGGSAALIFDELGIYQDSVSLAADLMNAGCDKSSPTAFFGSPLKQAVEKGLVDERRLNDAVSRILYQKIESGLFDHPYVDPAAAMRVNNNPEHREASLEIARQSLVLLKNENNTLPFSKDVDNVAVVGPLGNWLLTGHYGGFGRHEVTVLEGIRNLLPNANVRFAKGVEMKYFAYPAIDAKYFNGTLKASYFNNKNLSGEALYSRQEKKIEYDWGEKSPEGLPEDNFSVRWTGTLTSPVTKNVIFGSTADDGMRVWINDSLIIDMWYGGSRRLTEASVFLEKGKKYNIKAEYFDGEFNAYAQLGWDVDLEEDIADALAIAQKSEVIVAVMGMYENENRDRADLDLAAEQEKLLLALAKLNKPMVVILQHGSVITMHDWLQEIDAVMVSWYPGCEGGNAIAQTIFGDYNPGGKLPLTFPKVTGQVPLNYNRFPKGKGKIQFIGEFNEPAFCFGHGLSYTTFKYDNLQISSPEIEPADTLYLKCSVTNNGSVAGDEVVQLYIHDRYASLAQPLKRLSDFKRIHLKPGETKIVQLKLTPDRLKLWDKELNHVVEPGDFDVMIGSSSDDIRLNGEFAVVR